MEVKQIENQYFKKFCEVIEEYYSGAVERCSATIKDASYDTDNKVYVYNYDEPNMTILKLDEFSELFAENRRNQGYKKRTFSAVDTVCIDSDNNWYLIEFKNQNLSNAKNSIKEKALSSLWLLFYTYSVTGHISDIAGNMTDDIIKFAREHITYIVVCTKDKNQNVANNIHMKEAMNEHYTSSFLNQYIDFSFKDAYIYTEQELRKFILKFK